MPINTEIEAVDDIFQEGKCHSAVDDGADQCDEQRADAGHAAVQHDDGDHC